MTSTPVTIDLPDGTVLAADLGRPAGEAVGLVVFAHGSGSSRHSTRNRHVAVVLQSRGLETLLLDLLTPAEERVDRTTREHRFDIGLLARRVVGAIDWVRSRSSLPLGLFGASTGAAAALVAAAERPDEIDAVVSRGGRPDLAGDALRRVRTPTLLIVGGNDRTVLQLNREAQAEMRAAPTALEVVPGATHLFEEPGTLDTVADLAASWFRERLVAAASTGET